MSRSLSTVFVSEDLDNANALEEQVSSHFLSDEPSSCLFDILSSTQAGHSSLLEDIDLDLKWEEDDVDCTNNAVIEEIAGHTLHTVYNFNGAVYSTSVATAEGYKIRPLIPPLCQIEDQSSDGRSQIVDGNSRQFTFSFPISLSESKIYSKANNLTDQKFATCRHCSIQFSSKEALLVHNKDQHVKKEIHLHECIYCHMNFQNKKSLNKHLKIHKEKQDEKNESCSVSSKNCVFLCQSCSYVGMTRTHLSDHIKAKHSSERNVYSCEKCTFSCLQEQTLTLHLQRHEGDPKFACDQCGKLFFTMGILKRHAHTHSKTRAFLCQFQHCRKSFNIKSRLTDHIRTVHQNKRPSHDINSASDSCNPTACPSDEYFSHSKQPYSPFSKDCKQNNSSELSELDLHISNDTPAFNSADIFIYDVVLPEDKLQHFNSAVNEGNNCRASCSYNKVLMDKNMIWHKSQNSFCSDSKVRIDHCPDSQSNSSQKDVKERKFACTWDGCDKTFRDNYNLYVHRCTHTGDMQRACSLCRYRCVQKSAMDAHMKTHNKVMQKDVWSISA